MKDTKPKSARFLEYLRTLRDDRGAMATLRRALAFDPGEPGEVAAYRYVEPFVKDESDDRRMAYYLVAGLFALHPEESDKSLPQVLVDLWQEDQRPRSSELRFLALLDSDPDQLSVRMRRVITYIRSRGRGVDYERLLKDLLQWTRPGRRVQRRWARLFYRTPEVPQTEQAEVEA